MLHVRAQRYPRLLLLPLDPRLRPRKAVLGYLPPGLQQLIHSFRVELLLLLALVLLRRRLVKHRNVAIHALCQLRSLRQ